MYASLCSILVLLFNVNPNNYNKFGKKRASLLPLIKCLLFFHKKPPKTETKKIKLIKYANKQGTQTEPIEKHLPRPGRSNLRAF